jgi:hypothetical protein
MAASRARIDRRLPGRQPTAAVVLFHDAWGGVTKRFDMGELGLPDDVTILLSAAFTGHHAASTPRTQRGCWRSLTVFARFANHDGQIGSAADLTSSMVGRFIAWLDCQTGDVSPNPRKFCQVKFSPATIASRSITCPLSRKV